MIEAIQVKNFKSLKEVDVELGDFTVIVGRNNSGKSSFIEAIMCLYEIADTGGKFEDLPHNPEYVNYTWNDPKRMFFRDDEGQADSVTIIPCFDISQKDEYASLETLAERGGLDEILQSKYWVGAELTSTEWEPRYAAQRGDGRVNICTPSVNKDQVVSVPTSEDEVETSRGDVFNINLKSTGSNFGQFVRLLERIAINELNDIYYLTSERDVHNWQADPKEYDFVGHRGERAVRMLHPLRDNPDVFERIVDEMSNLAPGINEDGLFADMYVNNTRIELEDDATGERFNILISGEGLRRVLPIIMQVAVANEGDTVIIDDPDVGLYPEAQGKLVEYLTEAISTRGIQIIVTTHSLPFVWKAQEHVPTEMSKGIEFRKEDGRSIVEDKRLENIMKFEEYFGGDSN